MNVMNGASITLMMEKNQNSERTKRGYGRKLTNEQNVIF